MHFFLLYLLQLSHEADGLIFQATQVRGLPRLRPLR